MTEDQSLILFAPNSFPYDTLFEKGNRVIWSPTSGCSCADFGDLVFDEIVKTLDLCVKSIIYDTK